MVEVWTTTLDSVPMSLGYIFQSTEVYNEVLYAFIILVCVYVLIIFDVRSETSLHGFSSFSASCTVVLVYAGSIVCRLVT